MATRTVIVRGIEYPSIAAAARAHGVSPKQADKRIRERGWTEEDACTIPTDGSVVTPWHTRPGRSVTIDGVEYLTVAAAAKAHGVAPQTAWKRIAVGWDAVKACTQLPPKRKHDNRFKHIGGALITPVEDLDRPAWAIEDAKRRGL
jgi:transposase-like protein